MYLVFHNVKLLLLLFLPSCEGFFKNKKNTRQDSWLPANTLDKRVIQSRPRLLATQSLIGREEWLPPNGYSPQHMYHDLSVSYVTRVVQPLLFQPYASCYPLTHSSAFQHKMRYLMGRLPIVRPQVFFLKDGPENWGCGITLLRCRWKTGRNNEAQTWTLRQFTNDRNKRAEITGGKMVPIQKNVVTAYTFHNWPITLRAASPSPFHTLEKSWYIYIHYLTIMDLLTRSDATVPVTGYVPEGLH